MLTAFTFLAAKIGKFVYLYFDGAANKKVRRIAFHVSSSNSLEAELWPVWIRGVESAIADGGKN
ncbi:MAG: hypothetical protein Q8O55_08990 [Dehalococcoidales bacterium]|nr:hypothetical protein [Dehalococcoidales bacterium]